jgi:non-haem Fe2+, alpha-ketoglutarate-dependent halogenase
MIEQTSSLSDELRSQGVVGPLPAFAPVDAIQRSYDFLKLIIDEQASHPLYGRYSLRDWHLASDDILSILTAPELIESLRRATGAGSLILWRSKIFEKYPGDGPIDWHQEYGYFDGEEVGGHRPSLYPLGPRSPWNWSVWLPLCDVTETHGGVMEFVPGSNHVRYATRMVPLTQSGFFLDPNNRVVSKADFLQKAKTSSLVEDLDTSALFDGVDVDRLSVGELHEVFRSYCDGVHAAVTDPFDAESTLTVPMSAGQYVLFSERCMHRSRGSSKDARMRIAISARYTLGSTLVYPQRNTDSAIDGVNLDISNHACVAVLGTDLNPLNRYRG